MSVEIQILSGARRGERIVLDAEEFRAGGEPDCDVYFDPRSDPPARNRSAQLRLTSEGWFVKSTGSGDVLINQSPVVREDRIRSGDVVRLSEFGPDFSFAITSRGTETSATSAPASDPSNGGMVTGVSVECATADEEHADVLDNMNRAVPAATRGVPHRPSSRIVSPILKWSIGAAAALSLMASVGLTFGWLVLKPREQVPADGGSLVLETVPAQLAEEGAQLSVRLGAKTKDGHEARTLFSLRGEAPRGARIDSHDRVFTWTPNEEQGPGRYRIRIEAAPIDNKLKTEHGEFWIDVREVNSPPVIQTVGEKTIAAGGESTFSITVDDSDRPVNRQTFRLLEGPQWISVDPTSGQVRCAPPETADGDFEATVQVADDGQPPLDDQTTIRVTVRGNPWIRAQKELQEALFLVQVELSGPSSQFTWPFATCCAIGDDTLLTTAREVLQMATWQRQGYKVWAFCPATGLKTAVTDFRVHGSFPALAQSAGDWVYVNLGLLRTEKRLPVAARLGTASDVSDLEEGLPLGCFGFTHDGSKITRFDSFEPQRFLGQIYLLSSPRDPAVGQPVLELKARIPENTYGSPIVTREGRVVAVYSAAFSSEATAVKDLHYATSIDFPLLDLWLKGDGADAWLPPPMPEPASASPTESKIEPN